MTRAAASRYGYWAAIGALSVAIVVLGVWMLFHIAIPELQRANVIGAVGNPAASAAPSESPGPTPPVTMGGAIIPADATCAGCHKTDAGGIGLRPIPVMGHPLEGWSKCTSCHATARLVDTAPGHTGIHASECTICHKPGDLPAPLSRPHRDNQNVACLSCHGSKAPLPSDMTHRKETVCWLCHRLPTVEPPVPAHDTAVGEKDCLTCHKAGGRAGRLPADHVERPATLCLSCHEVTLGTMPGSSPSGSPGTVVWPAPSSESSPLVIPPVPLSP